MRRDTLSALRPQRCAMRGASRDTCQTSAGGTGVLSSAAATDTGNASSVFKTHEAHKSRLLSVSEAAGALADASFCHRLRWLENARAHRPPKPYPSAFQGHSITVFIATGNPKACGSRRGSLALEPRCALIEARPQRRAARNPLPETLSRRVSKRSHGCETIAPRWCASHHSASCHCARRERWAASTPRSPKGD